MSDDIKNLPPQNIEAEKASLGAMIQEREAIRKAIAEGIVPEEYYLESHRRACHGIFSLFKKNIPVDFSTLKECLQESGDLEIVGGVAYLSDLVDSVPHAANIKYHVRIVKGKAELRSIIEMGRSIVKDAFAEVAPDQIFSRYREKAKDLCRGRGGDIVSMADVTKETFAFVETLHKSKDTLSGVKSGFRDVDSLTGGWQPGDQIILGARPGMLKSILAWGFAQRSGVSTGFISLEMTKKQLGIRSLSSLSQVEIMRLRTGLLNKEHWPALTKAAGAMADLPIHLSFQVRDIAQLEQVITQMVERQGIELLIVDYLQRVRNSSARTREREVAEVSGLLKDMALTHNIPVIALCQLNRAIENRNDKTPTLADLRDSGQIEQDADVVIFIHRDDPQARSGPVDLIFAKGRNIGLGKVTLYWDGDKMTFHDIEARNA